MTRDRLSAHIDAVIRIERRESSEDFFTQSVMELFDVAWEDDQCRLPIDPGYRGRWARESRLARRHRERVFALVPRIAEEEVDEVVLTIARRLAAA